MKIRDDRKAVFVRRGLPEWALCGIEGFATFAVSIKFTCRSRMLRLKPLRLHWFWNRPLGM